MVVKKIKSAMLFISAVMLLLLCGCKTVSVSENESATEALSEVYHAPEMQLSVFHTDKAQEVPGGYIDLSATEEGYIAIKIKSENKLKFQITLDDKTYTYDLPGDLTETVFPLNMGSGVYSVQIMENVVSNKYTKLWGQKVEITLKDEFQPYLRPSQIVNYCSDSQCVKKASDLALGCRDDLEVANAIYNFLVDNITYDYDKAQTVQSGYLPDPDETLSTGKGICFDYASLACAMLRSQGIACQLITGYVSPNDIYHAWNRVYIKNQGWLNVEIKKNSWNRIDITFAASGVDPSAINDDSRYTTRYIY